MDQHLQSLADRLVQYFKAGMASGDNADRWQILTVQALIAHDRPKDLEILLQGWIAKDDPDNRWRLALGYLLMAALFFGFGLYAVRRPQTGPLEH